MIWIKCLIFTLVAPATLTIYLPILLFHPYRWDQLTWVFWLGAAITGMGIAIYGWCLWEFAYRGRGTPAPIDPPKELVIKGLYRYVRNPMYIGIITILLGETVAFFSINLLYYTLIVFLGFNAFVLIYEEYTLERLFGESYRQYRREVSRWIPHWRK